jgi:hypothetical protein
LSLNNFESFWLDALENGCFQAGYGWPDQLSVKEIMSHFSTWQAECGVRGKTTPHMVTITIRRCCPSAKKVQIWTEAGTRPYVWKFPSLKQARADFSEVFFAGEWTIDEQTDQP